MEQNKILIAAEGMIWTDGGEVFGIEIDLGEGVSADAFYQITIEEYNRILAEQAEEELKFMNGAALSPQGGNK